MPARLWGRAEGVRTCRAAFLRRSPRFLFGVISEQLAAHHRSANAASNGFGANSSAQGLEYTFLVMLAPLLMSAFLMRRAGRTYPRDIATAIPRRQRARAWVPGAYGSRLGEPMIRPDARRGTDAAATGDQAGTLVVQGSRAIV